MYDPITIGIIAAAWVCSLLWGLLVVAKKASRWTLEGLGLVEVEQNGKIVLAAVDPEGNPIKVPVAIHDSNGNIRVEDRYAPLAYALPTIAAMQVKATLMGKAGSIKQQAEKFARGELPLEQAAQAMALEAFSRGKYGQALMSIILPSVVSAVQNRTGAAGAGLLGPNRPQGQQSTGVEL